MADGKAKNRNDISEPHTEVAQIRSKGYEPADVIALAGYVGVAPNDGVLRLHPGLDDMSMSVDIPRDAIVATRDAPVSTMPMGGIVIWVSRTAEVIYRRTRTVSARAQQVQRYFGAGPVLEPESTADRLDIRVRPVMRHGVPPVFLPPEVCNPCHSTNCHSECSVCTSHE